MCTRRSFRSFLGLIGISFLLAPTVLASSSLVGLGEQLGVSPFLDWKTLTTENFRITYPEPLAEMALRAGRNLEEAHTLLAPLMKWSPRYKTQVMILDNSDFANGLAAATARFGIVLWITPPDNWMSIAHYDDWFRMVCIHEYAHILNLDATHDFWNVLRWIAGDGTLPNSLWPPWMLEGLAVTIETAYTRSGRGRSSYYSMVTRALEDGGVLADSRGIWRLSGPRTEVPGGEVPYFFGSMLMAELASEDLGRLGDLSVESSKSFPWFLNRYSQRVSGRDWLQHWEQWLSKARTRAQEQIAAIRQADESKPEWLTSGNYTSWGVTFSPDGKWMAYSREAMDRRQGVYLRNRTDGKESRVCDQLGGSSMGFTPDSRALIFSRVDRKGLYDFFSDLWIYDLITQKSYRLSSGARYRDPSTSRASDWVVFTGNDRGRTNLIRAKLVRDSRGVYQLQEPETLFRPDALGRVSTPRISADGSRVLFSLHENGQVSENIWELASSSGSWQSRQLTFEKESLNRFPQFSPNGEVVYVSNRTGVDNVYRYDPRSQVSSPITNVITGIWLPSFSFDGRLAGSVYRSSGWDIAWINSPEGGKAHPPILSTKEVPVAKVAQVEPKASDWRVSDYSNFPSILPRSWSPYLLYSDIAGWSVGSLILGFDALDVHRYLARIEAQPNLREWGADLSYSNRALGAVWTLRGSRSVQSILETQYSRELEVGLGLSLYYPETFSSWLPSIRFAYSREDYFALPEYRSQLGSALLSRFVNAPNIVTELSYRGTQSSRQSVWAEEGFNFRLGNRSYLGSLSGATQFLWTQSHYWHLGNHFVMSPSWQVAASHRQSLRLEGRYSGVFDVLSQPDYDRLVVRGYPQRLFLAKHAAVAALDLRFPIRRVERGLSTYPLFLQTIEGLGFVEGSIRRRVSGGLSRLPSWGVGVLTDWTLFYGAPISVSLQYHQGLAKDLGGRGEVFVNLQLGQLSF